MKIGILCPVGRTDRYGYQYDMFTKIVLDNFEKFANHIIIVGSSRYIKKELFENRNKIEFISNEHTWFNIENGEEVFSMSKSAENMNFIYNKMREEGYDVAIQIHINQYIPKWAIESIYKVCQKMLTRDKPFSWLYKSYQCGNLIFNPDRRIPWILNLTRGYNIIMGADSIKFRHSEETISIQTGNYKKYNKQAIIDVYGEYTIQDAKEKHDFTIKELRILNNTFDPSNLDNLKFDEKLWIDYMQNRIYKKSISKNHLDETGKELVKIRKKEFLSNIFEQNYKSNF